MNGILAILGVAIAIGVVIVAGIIKRGAKSSTMFKYADQTRNVGYGLLVLAIIFLGSQSVIIVDAGEIAVQVQFGAVLPDTVGEGMHFKSPLVNIVTYNLRLQEFTMQASSGDSVDARTADNSHVSIDATVLWSIDGKRAFDIYRSTANSNDSLIDILIRPTIRNALYDMAAQYPLEKIMTDRENYGLKVRDRIVEQVSSRGLIVDKVLIRAITPPPEVDTAIKAKLSQQQALESKTYELQTAQKNAEIKKADAEGTAMAQDIIQQKLTPLYVQYEAIQSYAKLAGSPNTTFVIMPTSPNGTGMPIILGAPK